MDYGGLVEMVKDLMKTSLELTKTGVVSGIGAGVIKESGGDPAVVTNMSKHLPTVGSVAGAGSVFKQLKKLG